MIASAQFTIISLCDVVTSDTPPENPYEGQLWVDTSVTPPETKIWDGNEWVVQNDIETIRTTISILTEKDAQFQQTIDGLNSYVATLTETVETVSNDQGVLEERVLNSESRVSELEHTVDGLSVTMQEQYIGGINYVQNSSGLNIEKDSYWANVKRATEFELDYMLSKAGKPVDRDEWGMTPQTVNAYYNPTTNEICFPAGILQYPFFDMNADDAFNYGAIGVVIGHEMTHGFDDQGRQFDKDGNLKDWWTAEDAKRFEERAQVMVNFFDSIQVLPGLNANGSLTLGENIADHGGLQVSFQAFKNATKDAPLPVEDGFTPEQRFFLSYAGVWAGNIRDEQIRLQTKSDPHSLGRWRVNGALPQIGAWYDAFGIKEGDPMYLAPEKRVSIW